MTFQRFLVKFKDKKNEIFFKYVSSSPGGGYTIVTYGQAKMVFCYSHEFPYSKIVRKRVKEMVE